MKLNNKKGFTIVELVIVIAVIAILAAVLIPNISNLVKKANASADESLVRNLNTALSLDTEKHATMSDALKAAKDNGGYELTTIVAKNKNSKILWDSKNDCFVYLNGEKIVYLPNTKTETAADVDLFEIVSEKPADFSKLTYSIYCNFTDDISTVEGLTVGFDAGINKTVKTVKYNRSSVTDSNKAQNVTINMNGGALEVNAPVDTVKRYGTADSVVIVAVASASYHEYGEVVGNIKIENGRVVLENTAKVEAVVVAASSGVEVKAESGAELGFVAAETGITIDKSKVEVGTASIVEGSSGVSVNGKVYNTLSAAITAVKKGVFVLLSDLSEADAAIVLNSGENIILNLNGHTLTTVGIDIGKATVKVEGEGTILNSNKSRIFRLFGSTTDANAEDYSVLNIGKNVTVKATESYDVFVTSNDLSGVYQMNHYGIRITIAGKCVGTYGIYINGAVKNVDGACEWTIEESAEISGIYAAGYANWTINGGKFGDGNGTECEFAAGNIVINGGTFTGSDTKSLVITSNQSCSSGYALAILSRPGYSKSTVCVINGGDFATEIAVVNQDPSNAATIVTVNGIGQNEGIVKSGANVVAPGVAVSEYQEKAE